MLKAGNAFLPSRRSTDETIIGEGTRPLLGGSSPLLGGSRVPDLRRLGSLSERLCPLCPRPRSWRSPDRRRRRGGGGRMLGRPDHGRGGSLRPRAARLRRGQGSPRGGERLEAPRACQARAAREAVLAHAEAVSLVSIPASQIDRIGLRSANLACLERALRALGERAELRLVDGNSRSAPARPRTSGSSAETQPARPLRRPRSWPRRPAIASWLAWTSATRATASSVIRATGRRSTRPRSRSSGRPASTA